MTGQTEGYWSRVAQREEVHGAVCVLRDRVRAHPRGLARLAAELELAQLTLLRCAPSELNEHNGALLSIIQGAARDSLPLWELSPGTREVATVLANLGRHFWGSTLCSAIQHAMKLSELEEQGRVTPA